MAFTAKDVQALRETTGVGMMDCKKALTEADGDMDKAVEILRERGLAVAAKKAGRVAADGMVYSFVGENGVGAIVEVNSETDFVAKNEDFQSFVKNIAKVVADSDPADIAALGALPYPGSSMTVSDMVREKVLVIGENIQIRRFVRYCGKTVNVSYVHMGGKIGVLVGISVSDNLKGNAAVAELGKDMAMQIAAMRPQWLKPADVDPKVVAEEKEILLAQTLNEGKPQNVAEKIVAGRINKYYEEVCLLNQPFVKENKLTVGKHIEQTAKELGGSIEVTKFVRYEKGEGLAKREDNFADEVAKMVK
jgi:elongation factor Ts